MNIDTRPSLTATLNHNLSDINLLIHLEEKQVSLMKETLNNLEGETLEIGIQKLVNFKRRFLIIVLFTIMLGVYAMSTVSSVTMSYTEPYFYIILIGSLVWMFLLRYHFSENLKYQSKAYFELENIIVDKERNLEILNNMKDDLGKLIK